MNIIVQLCLENIEIWRRIKTIKEFEWDNRGKIYYQGIMAIP